MKRTQTIIKQGQISRHEAPDAKGLVGDRVQQLPIGSPRSPTGPGAGEELQSLSVVLNLEKQFALHPSPQVKEEMVKDDEKEEMGRQMETPGDMAREKESMF